MLNDYQPANHLEKVILDAKAGRLPMKVLAGTLLGSEILLPSVSEVKGDLSNFQPLVFNKEGASLLAAFTSAPLMLPFRQSAEYFAELSALTAFQRLPPGFGVLFNANSPVTLELSAEGIREMLHDFTTVSRGT